MRDRLYSGIVDVIDGVTLNGPRGDRLPGNLNLGFAWVRGEALLMGLRGVAVSTGSACTSASPEASHVLRAMGVEEELAHASLRFGLGRFTTAEEVDLVIDEIRRVVPMLREMSPDYALHRQARVLAACP